MDVLKAPTLLLWIPCPDAACAERIALEAVERRLAACANILPGMRSIYRWEGSIQRDDETLLVLKTSEARAEELTNFVTEAHPYDVPAVSRIPVSGGSEAFLEWVGTETAPPS